MAPASDGNPIIEIRNSKIETRKSGNFDFRLPNSASRISVFDSRVSSFDCCRAVAKWHTFDRGGVILSAPNPRKALIPLHKK
jgi:hypothetical protein